MQSQTLIIIYAVKYRFYVPFAEFLHIAEQVKLGKNISKIKKLFFFPNITEY